MDRNTMLLADPFWNQILDERKRRKKRRGTLKWSLRDTGGGEARTHAVLGGRVREGNPPKLWSNFVQGPRDASQGRRI